MNGDLLLVNELVNHKTRVYDVVKRIFDIICGILGLIMLLPVSIIIKISYVLNKDFDSIFYTQDRIGKNGKIFKMYKFRTMVPNADLVLSEYLSKNAQAREEWEKYQKISDDCRITKMGKILRKLSLDEIPQIGLNVLFNDMSMIGPRPLVVGELDAHGGNHEIYESVKPGVTGWWACNGRSAITYEDRLKLEYFYCKNYSLWLDIKCVLYTVVAIFTKKGAK